VRSLIVSAINVALIALSALLFVPAAVYSVECLLATLIRSAPREVAGSRRPDIAVVIPAHNEEGIIGDTIRQIATQLAGKDRLIVVADNCMDRTAEEAAEAGADVWERQDADQRGKGYAISFAVERLSASPPEVLILIDADCQLDDGLIDTIGKAALASNRPVQARYLFVAPPGSGRLSQISSLACLVRNYVRPLGLKHLGLPCHLTGSGMAFVWEQIKSAPGQGGNIVEDLALGLEMAIAGNEPMVSTEAIIRSDLPGTGKAATTQRQRWEHGQMATFVAFAPRLAMQSILQRRLSLMALALDLAVPPLALLVALTSLVAAANFLFGLFFGEYMALAISAASLLLIVVATIGAWVRYGRSTVSGLVLLSTPFYILWKLPLYVAALLGRGQKEWVRTDRDAGK
jgi:glycosyltransferase involved in cell wall biosynthesis